MSGQGSESSEANNSKPTCRTPEHPFWVNACAHNREEGESEVGNGEGVVEYLHCRMASSQIFNPKSKTKTKQKRFFSLLYELA